MDVYDVMDKQIEDANRRLAEYKKLLEQAGVKVASTTDADYDTDGDIDLGMGYAVQVRIHGGWMLTQWDGKALGYPAAGHKPEELVKCVQREMKGAKK